MTDVNTYQEVSQPNEDRQKVQFFNARDARSMMELGLMSVEFPPEVVPLVGEAVGSGLIAGDEVKVLFSKPGFSLIHAWLKKDYPLSPHSHDADCLYWIVSGELQYGTQILGKGDGFFVPANVPYAYIPVGDNGVEVLEFRHTETFNFKARSGENFWRKAIETCKSNSQSWKDARSPLIETKSANSPTANQAEWTNVANRFWHSLDTGNVDEAIACCLPTATTWHNFDQKTLDLKDAGTGFRAFVAAFSERSTTNIRRHFLNDGLLQQHVLTVRQAAGSPQMAWEICVIMRFSEGRIASVEEYIDRSAVFDPAATAPT